MTNIDQEAQWRKEFEEVGREAVHDVVNSRHGSFEEPKRQFAFRWLREKEKVNERRADAEQWYSKWTFWVAVAAAVLALIGIIVPIAFRH